VLFAAGRASVRPNPARFAWPAVAACLAVLAAALGGWAASERTERLALARLLQHRQPPTVAPAVSPSSPEPAEALAAAKLPPDSILASHRLLERGLESWPEPTGSMVDQPANLPVHPPVLSVWSLDQVLNH
jgi:hypothetical protein